MLLPQHSQIFFILNFFKVSLYQCFHHCVCRGIYNSKYFLSVISSLVVGKRQTMVAIIGFRN